VDTAHRRTERLGADRGTLVIFDRRKGVPPPHERTRFDTDRTPSGRQVTVVRA
jgi:hypothetical protein